jgi:predicted  nucleic acid-binding Zn-ribbon protein
MSIAVRVSVWILGLLVLISAAVAVLTLMQKQNLQNQNQSLQNRISDDASKIGQLTAQAQKLQDQAVDLNNKISQSQQEKAQIQTQYDDLKHKSDDLQSQLDQANTDRDDWKNRSQTITRERDQLLQKLKSRPVVYKDRPVKTPVAASSAPDNATSSSVSGGVQVISSQGEGYWATVLKQKAALQVELQKEKNDLDQAALQVVDLKKQNSDLELQLKQLANEKDEVVSKIKYGQDLADNLSIDLARARNDQEVVTERADKVKGQNEQLLNEIRQLSSDKLSLERTVSRLTDEKDAMQRKLAETQSVIQSRIDDIWKIKENLDKKLSENSSAGTNPGSMELPPIIVNAPGSNNSQPQQSAPVQTASPGPAPAQGSGKTQGTIISINESNNFVIVDLGQDNSSVSVGNALKVFRNSSQIATLEVIQVRRDICAGDIKDKSTELKVGDTVKFN